MKVILFCLFLILPVGHAAATTWYVGPTGHDTNNDCTEAQSVGTPKLTIAAALACVGTGAGAGAGHTVTVADGTYTQTISSGWPSGTSGNRFTLRSTNSRKALIQPGTTSSAIFQFNTGTALYINVVGFTLDGVNVAANNVFINNGTTDITFDDVEVKNTGTGVCDGPGSFQGVYSDGKRTTFRNGKIHDVGGTCRYCHGIYLTDSDNLVENTEIFNIGGTAIHAYSQHPWQPTNNIARFNRIYDYGAGDNGAAGAILLDGSGGQAYGNVIFRTVSTVYSTGIHVLQGNGRVYNNTIRLIDGYEVLTVTGSGSVIKNNIISVSGTGSYGITISNTSGSVVQYNIMHNIPAVDQSGATGQTVNNNLVSDPLFISTGSQNFGLTATSPAINAGVSAIATGITRAFNGSAPDIGAHETFGLSSCSVESGDASTLRLVFENNVYPPVAGISTTGFSYRINAGAATAPNAAASGGTNQVNLTLQASVTAGQTVDFSYTTAGSMRDSANIGGGSNQRLNAITNQSCANNVSGGGGIILTVSHFRFHNLRSSSTSTPESTRYTLAATDNNVSVMPGALFGLRSKIKCTGGDCASMAVNLRYQKNGSGGYSLIPDTCGADNIAMVGTSNTSADIPAQGTSTTEQLTSDFATNVAGAIARTSSAIPNIDLAQDSEAEMEHLLVVCSGATLGHFYDFRPYKQDGTALDAYTLTPRVTVTSSRFMQ